MSSRKQKALTLEVKAIIRVHLPLCYSSSQWLHQEKSVGTSRSTPIKSFLELTSKTRTPVTIWGREIENNPLLSLSEIQSKKKAKLSIRKKRLKLIHGMN
jgi:hypothetical protein